MGVWCLSFHAGYQCRRTGRCCTDVWTVPADEHVVQLVARRAIDPPPIDAPLFISNPHAETGGASLVLAQYDGTCVFYERERGGLCSLHRQGGSDALPSSCRHFPRVHLRDGRGTFVSLSHFCPTAARMLLDDLPISIVEARAPLALDGEVEGLDATGTLPPLLTPEMLTDLPGYDAWERAVIGVLARPDLTHEEALWAIAAATDRVREWRPALGPLEPFVARSFEEGRGGQPPEHQDPAVLVAVPLGAMSDAERLDVVDSACAPSAGSHVRRADRSDARSSLLPFDAAVKRYLAARLFGSWLAYRAHGLRSIVEWMALCLALLRNEAARLCAIADRPLDADLFVEAVREVDRLVVHLVDTRRLAVALSRVESACVA